MAARLLVSGGTTVLELSVVREQSRRVQLREPAPERNRSHPLRVARMLAMAHEIERLIAEGAFLDRADAARKLGFTRARISQLLDLTLLAPDLQERLLTMETTSGTDSITEHRLRAVVAQASWRAQRRIFRIFLQG
jgi:ParB-like chromosome segregation protein Spo0J